MRKKRKSPRRVRNHLVYIKKTKVMDTITNIPLDPENRLPIFRKAEVQEQRKVRKGYHKLWRAVLQDGRGRFYLREVIA